MTCSMNTNVSLPVHTSWIGPLGIPLSSGRIEDLFEQASNELGFALNQSHSYKEIEDRLLFNLMACGSNSRYRKLSLLLPSEKGCCDEKPDKTTEKVRLPLLDICRFRPTPRCDEKKLSSEDTFAKSLTLAIDDLARIAERFQPNDTPETKKEVIAIGRELLDLQRQVSGSHYLFTHGMSRVHALLPKLITELDHRLWPKRDSKDFIFARVVPPASPMTELNEIFQKLKVEDDHDLRKELLSVDADLLNRELYESAFYFYLANYNPFQEINHIVCLILSKFAEEFGYSITKCEEDFGSGVDTAINTWGLSEGQRHGALLAYAVPKTLVYDQKTNFIYTSLPYGEPVDQDNPLSRLEELASDPHHDTGLSVRLLTSHLRPENGIKAFWVGEKKTQDEFDLQWRVKFTEIANSFFDKILQHCSAQSAARNAECERLLRETAARAV
jgi:hypothetical protein